MQLATLLSASHWLRVYPRNLDSGDLDIHFYLRHTLHFPALQLLLADEKGSRDAILSKSALKICFIKFYQGRNVSYGSVTGRYLIYFPWLVLVGSKCFSMAGQEGAHSQIMSRPVPVT